MKRNNGLLGSCCFTCVAWIGKRRKGTAYCKRLNLSGKDATRGDAVCILWEKRINARMPNVSRQESPGEKTYNAAEHQSHYP